MLGGRSRANAAAAAAGVHAVATAIAWLLALVLCALFCPNAVYASTEHTAVLQAGVCTA